jgi:2-oxoisovalerate dehydrogenase E1 component
MAPTSAAVRGTIRVTTGGPMGNVPAAPIPSALGRTAHTEGDDAGVAVSTPTTDGVDPAEVGVEKRRKVKKPRDPKKPKSGKKAAKRARAEEAAERKAAAKAARKAKAEKAERAERAKAGKAKAGKAKAGKAKAGKAKGAGKAKRAEAKRRKHHHEQGEARGKTMAGNANPDLVTTGDAAGDAGAVPVASDGPAPPRGPAAYAPDELRRDLLLACISRSIDDREIALQKQSRVFFQISGAGHEALYLALAHELRPGYDWFFPYYRDLALVLGLGLTAEQVLLQAVGSSEDPASGGRQMPAHWGYRPFNIVTQSSPTGSQCIPAVGCAEAGRYIVRRPDLGLPAHGDELTYVSLGEGATSEGEFWESLNTACTEHLPVVFVVADNGYAISVPSSEQAPASVSEMVSGFAGLQVRTVDGTDYFAVREVAAEVVPHVRAGVGPALIHARVTRPYSHSAADTQSKYRLPTELEWEREHDPIDRFERDLIDAGVIDEEQGASIRAEARRIVAEAARSAIAAPRPDPATVLDHVVALPDIPDPGEPPAPPAPGAPGGGGEVTPEVVAMGEAIRRAMHEVMAADERVRVFGEDVGDAREAIIAEVDGKGGVFGTTHGLQREFGRARCFNTPLAEANIIGRAVGQGIRGLRPAPEIQFFDYIWPAMQQIKSEAATIRWRSHGAWTCPMVIRVPIGGYLQGGAIWHSQSGESIFAHVPGLLVAFPSRASDAAGLLRAAFRCEDPVLFLEHKHLLRQPYTRDPFPGPDHVVPFGKGRRVTEGDDLTLVTWGATVERSRQAAARLAEAGDGRVEVIDLRTIVPYDREMIAESVGRTSRLLVVHEDIAHGGFGGEIAAWASDELFWDLDAPVVRVGAQNCHVAYAPELETAILPQVGDIEAAARRVLGS